MLGQLRYQTRPPDETLVYCADTPDLARLKEDFPEATFHDREARGDWGHEDRAEGLYAATSEWVGFFNDDDTYDRHYLDLMLRGAVGSDAVFCGWQGDHGCDTPGFRLGSSTSGNYLVKTAIGQAAGYTDRTYEADGHFINRIAQLASHVAFVPEVLYFHNKQEA